MPGVLDPIDLLNYTTRPDSILSRSSQELPSPVLACTDIESVFLDVLPDARSKPITLDNDASISRRQYPRTDDDSAGADKKFY